MALTDTTTATRGLIAANLICLASMVVWAGGLPAGELITPHMPPLALTAGRALLAALVLLPIWWAVEGFRAATPGEWLRGSAIGFVALGLASVFVVIALVMTDSVTVAVVTATMPVVGIALEVALDGRPVTRALILGLVLSLVGGAIALSGVVGALDLGLGAAAAFASVLAYTWGSRATVKALPGLTPLGRCTVTVAGTAAIMTALALADGVIRGTWPDWGAIGLREFGGLAVFGIGSMAVSQLLWIVAVGRLGIGTASLHMNAVPFYVMLIVFLFGGPWVWAQAIGAAIVVLGALIAQGLIRAR
jgi:drug/metabolite transporter (DMT)-like permease